MACLPRRQRTTATSGWTTTAGSTAVSSGPESCGSARPVWPAPRYRCTPAVRAFGYCRNGSGKPSSSAMNRLAPQKLTRSPSQGRLPDDARADTEPQADSCAADRPPPWSPDRHAVPPRYGSGTRAGSIPAYLSSALLLLIRGEGARCRLRALILVGGCGCPGGAAAGGFGAAVGGGVATGVLDAGDQDTGGLAGGGQFALGGGFLEKLVG